MSVETNDIETTTTTMTYKVKFIHHSLESLQREQTEVLWLVVKGSPLDRSNSD